MALKYGRSKHMDAVSLADCLKHPIWVRAPDTSRYSEEGRRPISNRDAVDAEVLASRLPIITLRVRGTDTYGIGFYDHKGRNWTRSGCGVRLVGWVPAGSCYPFALDGVTGFTNSLQ
jgi:hypothetical protein